MADGRPAAVGLDRSRGWLALAASLPGHEGDDDTEAFGPEHPGNLPTGGDTIREQACATVEGTEAGPVVRADPLEVSVPGGPKAAGQRYRMGPPESLR